MFVGFEQVPHLSTRYLVRGADCHQNHSSLQGSANFSVNRQTVNTVGLVVSTSQLFHHRAKLDTDKTKANEHGWVTVKTYWNLIITEFPGALTYSSSFDFFQLLRSMKTLLSALPIQNHPKLPKHKQPTGTHRVPLCKVYPALPRVIKLPWGIMFGLAGLLEEGDFTDLSLLCNNEHLITEQTSRDEMSRLEFLVGRNAPSPNSCSQCPWQHDYWHRVAHLPDKVSMNCGWY